MTCFVCTVSLSNSVILSFFPLFPSPAVMQYLEIMLHDILLNCCLKNFTSRSSQCRFHSFTQRLCYRVYSFHLMRYSIPSSSFLTFLMASTSYFSPFIPCISSSIATS
ncbi:hypothetical protein QOT17_025479 [Balamuthia mandrillaris]